MNKYFLLAAMGIIFIGCGGSRDYVKKGEVVDTLEQGDTRKLIKAVGIGAADAELPTQTQRRATSRSAAIVAAQYELLSKIKGLELEGGIRVERAIETDSLLETKIQAAIKGADIHKTEWTKDDGAVVELHLPRKRLKKMMGIDFE